MTKVAELGTLRTPPGIREVPVKRVELGPPRNEAHWAMKQLPAGRADEGFYRIVGVKGSGKSHLTRFFLLDVLREVERNPHAKLIAYDPKREFYAWLKSLGLSSDVAYFCPSDRRSVALDFTKDYPFTQDSLTVAHAFYPVDPNEKQRFWGDALRTIFGGVFEAIRGKLGYVDMRLMCLVLEDEELTRLVLQSDPYLVQAQKLVKDHGDAVGETKQNIQMTIHSRVAEMKIMAAHLEHARKDVGLFSLKDFVQQPGSRRVLVVSKDSQFKLAQDPMNGVIFLRLTELLDAEQYDPRRKVFVVIDEFPTLAGDKPCPGITDMFLRLRSRGVTVLMTYQSQTTLKRIYGEAATENLGQCTNVIYLKQSDVESAEYAAKDLGHERGYERVGGVGFSGSMSGDQQSSGWSINQNRTWYDRPIHSHTELLNHLRKASKDDGIEGRAKSSEAGDRPWPFKVPPHLVDAMPQRHPDIQEYEKRGGETQRLLKLTDEERDALTRDVPNEGRARGKEWKNDVDDEARREERDSWKRRLS